jgi:hypothetical protein
METTPTKQKLHQLIDTLEDKKAEAIYTLLEDEINTDDYRRKLILTERAKYLAGEGSLYTWDEVKQMAIHKEQRNAT